jgi:hypothetical protein
MTEENNEKQEKEEQEEQTQQENSENEETEKQENTEENNDDRESPLERAKKLNDELAEKNKQIDEKIKKLEKLEANALISGRGKAGATQEKEETALEYQRRVMNGEI